MATENIILLNSASTISENFLYSKEQKGAGYYRKEFPLHTAIFQINDFKGQVKLQGTLILHPGEKDWFDIEYDNGLPVESIDNVPLTVYTSRNFTGNFVWIRAAFCIQDGTIDVIRYSV
jgi:hypothetical protein